MKGHTNILGISFSIMTAPMPAHTNGGLLAPSLTIQSAMNLDVEEPYSNILSRGPFYRHKIATMIAVHRTAEEAARVLAAPGASVFCGAPGVVSLPLPVESPAGGVPGLVLFVARALACGHWRAKTACRALCTSPNPVLGVSLVAFVHLRVHLTSSSSISHAFAAAEAEALTTFMMSLEAKGAACAARAQDRMAIPLNALWSTLQVSISSHATSKRTESSVWNTELELTKPATAVFHLASPFVCR